MNILKKLFDHEYKELNKFEILAELVCSRCEFRPTGFAVRIPIETLEHNALVVCGPTHCFCADTCKHEGHERQESFGKKFHDKIGKKII